MRLSNSFWLGAAWLLVACSSGGAAPDTGGADDAHADWPDVGPAPEVTAMVRFAGTAPADPLEFTFGDDEGCPAPNCVDDVVYAGQVFPTVRAKVAPFALDEHEVTTRQYEYCVQMGACDDLMGYNLGVAISSYLWNPKYGDYPVVLVRATDAERYCAFAGQQADPPVVKRLPTEIEWEYAIRAAGSNTAGWPWGSDHDGCVDKKIAAKWCQPDLFATAPVGTSSDDVVTVPGVGKLYDLMGNVSEWMANAPETYLTCLDDSPHCVPNLCVQDCAAIGCASCRSDGRCGDCVHCTLECGEGEECALVVGSYGNEHYDCIPNDCYPACEPVNENCVQGRCLPTSCEPACSTGEHCSDFSHECGEACVAWCQGDPDCASRCQRCGYCDPAVGGRDDCFVACGTIAMCVQRPASAFIAPDHLYPTDVRRAIRGGNWEVDVWAYPFLDKATQSGTCAMRNSARYLRKDRNHSSEWLGFRCAMDL